MDVKKLRVLARPRWTPAAGLMRGVGVQVDRRGARVTPIVIGNYWTRYWRNTPLLRSAPWARTTPSSTTTSHHRRRQSVSTTADSFSSSWASPSSATEAEISTSPTSAIDVPDQPQETTPDTAVLEGATSGSSDVTKLDVADRTSLNMPTVGISTTSSSKSRLPDSHSTMSNYLTNSSAASSHFDLSACDETTALTMRQSLPVDDVTTQNDIGSVVTESVSRGTHVTALTSSQRGVSRDDSVTGVDVNPHAAEEEDSVVQVGSSGQVNTASTSPGEVMTTYRTDDVGTLPGRSNDRQVQRGETTPMNAVAAASSGVDSTSDVDGSRSTMSGEDGRHADMMTRDGDTEALNDVTQLITNTRDTNTQTKPDVTGSNRRQNVTSPSATNFDERSTTPDQSAAGSRMTRGSTSAPTPAAAETSPSSDWWTGSLKQTGRGRLEVSGGVEQMIQSSVRTSSSPTEPASSVDDKLSLWPRHVLLKSTNSSDSTVYWSSQSALFSIAKCVITSAKEVMFSLAFVCLLAGLCKTAQPLTLR